jgi:hypothetical protein
MVVATRQYPHAEGTVPNASQHRSVSLRGSGHGRPQPNYNRPRFPDPQVGCQMLLSLSTSTHADSCTVSCRSILPPRPLSVGKPTTSISILDTKTCAYRTTRADNHRAPPLRRLRRPLSGLLHTINPRLDRHLPTEAPRMQVAMRCHGNCHPPCLPSCSLIAAPTAIPKVFRAT